MGVVTRVGSCDPDIPIIWKISGLRSHTRVNLWDVVRQVEVAMNNGNALHAVRTQCKVLYVCNCLNPSFGPFSPVSCSRTGFFVLLVH